MHGCEPIVTSNFDAKLVLEGVPGAGKTTLLRKCEGSAQAIQQSLGLKIVTLDEPLDRKMIKLFYKDKKKYALMMQMHALENRIKLMERYETPEKLEDDDFIKKLSLEMAVCRLEEGRQGKEKEMQVALQERGVMGDLCFAMANYILGNLEDREWKMYLEKIGFDPADASSIASSRVRGALDQIVCLVATDASESHNRIKADRNRSQTERQIPLWYVKMLEDTHFHVFIKLLAANCLCELNVVWPTTSEYFAQQLNDLVRHNKRTAEVGFRKPNKKGGERCAVYDEKTEGLIYTYHRMIHKSMHKKDFMEKMHPDEVAAVMPIQMELMKFMKLPHAIYFSEDICLRTVSAEIEPNSAGEKCARLGVRLHDDRYYFMVYWHLSQGNKVYFYSSRKQ